MQEIEKSELANISSKKLIEKFNSNEMLSVAVAAESATSPATSHLISSPSSGLSRCLSLAENPFKKADLGLKYINNSMAQGAFKNVTSPDSASQKQPSPKKISMLDILRNFDESERKEQILFSSEAKGAASKLGQSKRSSEMMNYAKEFPFNHQDMSLKSRVLPISKSIVVNRAAFKDAFATEAGKMADKSHEKQQPNDIVPDAFDAANAEKKDEPLKRKNSISAKLAIFENAESKPKEVVPALEGLRSDKMSTPATGADKKSQSEIGNNSMSSKMAVFENPTKEKGDNPKNNNDDSKTSESLNRRNSLSAKLALFEKRNETVEVDSAKLDSKSKPQPVKPSNEQAMKIKKEEINQRSLPMEAFVESSKKISKSTSVSELANRFKVNKSESAASNFAPAMTIKRSASISRLLSKFQNENISETPSALQPLKTEGPVIAEKNVSNEEAMKSQKVPSAVNNSVQAEMEPSSKVDTTIKATNPDNEPKSVKEKSSAIEDRERESAMDNEDVFSKLNKSTSVSSLVLDIPAINIGNMFDENDDHWISSLVNNSAEFDQTVAEIEKEIEKEKVEKVKEFKIEHVAVPEKIVEQTLHATAIIPIVKKPKKSVTFGVAWQGELETIRTIPAANEFSHEAHKGADGVLLLKVVNLCDIIAPIADERTVELEISQGDKSLLSSTYPIAPNSTQVLIDWESCLAIDLHTPIQFGLRLKEITNEKETTSLSRAKTLRDGFKTLGTKIFGKSEGSTTQMAHSDSTASFASLNEFKTASLSTFTASPLVGLKQFQIRSGHYIVSNTNEWLQPLKSNIQPKFIPFFQNEWDRPKNMFNRSYDNPVMGKLEVQGLFFEFNDSYKKGILSPPESLSEYRQGIQVLKLHRRVWKEGFMDQLGGDCDVLRRRYFKLTGDCLVAHHEMTIEPRATICLSHLVCLEYLTRSPDNEAGNESLENVHRFSLLFKDGRSIQFQTSEPSLEWIQAIEESHHVLKGNSLPCWL